MKLKDQVCTLEQAKRLKELGVKQESLCYYSKVSYSSGVSLNVQSFGGECLKLGRADDSGPEGYFISAYTVAELGEMLPFTVADPKDGQHYPLDIYRFKSGDVWHISYCGTSDVAFIKMKEPTEAQARAAMLIYLLENKLHTIN